MNHSESIAKLTAALVRAQAEIEHAHKNATNPHFRSQYADLAEVINTTRPVLNAHGLAVMQMPGFVNGAATLGTMLVHESGEWIYSESGAPLQKQDPQGVGSALTYLRRYSLAALCGIAQEDDDGEAASRPVRAKVEPASDELVEEVRLAWLEAARHGLDKANTTAMDNIEEAMKAKDATKLEKAKKWLAKKIHEAQEAEA